MSQQYTNEPTTDVLERLRQPPFTDEFLSELEPQSRQSLVAEMESMLQRPVLHIFRGATIGSLTRHGGVIRETSGKSTLDGHYSARVGDKVVYPDGREATIICGAGKGRVMQGESMALVGSMLDNGDEIISTPQGCQMFVFREGDALPDGFLTVPGDKH